MLCNHLTTPIDYQVRLDSSDLRADLFTNYESLEALMSNSIVIKKNGDSNSNIEADVNLLCYETQQDRVLLLTRALTESPIEIASVTVKNCIKLKNNINPGKYVLISKEGRHNISKYYANDVITQAELHPVEVTEEVHKSAIRMLKENFNNGDLKMYPLVPYEVSLVKSHNLNEEVNQLNILTKRPDDITVEGQFMYRLHVIITSNEQCTLNVNYSAISKEYIDAARKAAETKQE